MSLDGPGPVDHHRAEDLRTNVAAQVRDFFVASSHVAPIGNVVAGLVALSLLWDHVPHRRLWIWAGFVIALAARQALDSRNPELAVAQLEGSRFVIDTNVLAGLVWGSLPWLDVGAFGADEVYRWICLALAFAIGAGAMGGLSILTGLAMRVQIPLYLLVAVAFLVAGIPAVAIGVLVYLALMTGDMRTTGHLLRQLVANRVEAADLAVDANREARHDTLTGLLNRAGALERLEQHRKGGAFVLMFVDLDHFKEVNDRLGHGAGDHVLIETARRIQNVMRPEDVVARLGGDEFLVVFEQRDADLHEISRRVLTEVERPIDFGADEALISASIGLIVVEDDGCEVPELLRRADHALYEAKRTGRQRIVWFDDRLANELEQRTSLEDDLRKAIRNGAIEVAAQPAVDLRTGRISWVEITPRWQLEDGTAVPPSAFLAHAENLGLLDTLTRSILDRAAQVRVQWRGHPELGSASVTVRVVAGHLMRGGLVDDVTAIFSDHGLEPGELQLMLTETADIRDPQLAAEAINSIRAMGVGILLGEFGSGKSTLGDLLKLPIDVVSIHPRLVGDAPGQERLQQLLAGLQKVAAELGLNVMADGVDTPEQLAIVRRIGLPYAQGDAIAPPQAPDRLETLATTTFGSAGGERAERLIAVRPEDADPSRLDG